MKLIVGLAKSQFICRAVVFTLSWVYLQPRPVHVGWTHIDNINRLEWN